MHKLVSHIEGSKAYGIGYREWRRQRHFITAEIDRAGTFLDIGCANGFLVRCLQKWSRRQLVPYGIDIDPAAIKDARQLFPGRERHFVCGDVRHFVDRLPAGFPARHDYVFWNAPSDWPVGETRQQLARLISFVLPGGRLLLAVYGTNAPELNASERAAERQTMAMVFTDLEALGVGFAHIRYNPWGSHHAVALVSAVHAERRC